MKTRKLTALLMALVMFIGVMMPSTSVNAATTTVKDMYTGKTTTVTTLSQNYVYVNGTKINMTNIPVFIRSGNYMGSVAKIFKNSSLNVKLTDTKVNGVAGLKLTYGSKVLIISQGTNVATLNGTTVKLAAVPFRAYYTKSKVTRWVVPISSVCNKLGINYTRSSSGVISLTTKSNTTTTTTKKKIVIVIDAGHGGVDSGATGNGLKEKNLTLSIVLAAKKYFDSNSRFTVYYTRTSDTYPSLTSRSTLANNKNADLFLCVHINSYLKTSKGTETLYNANRLSSTKKNGITSKVLATTMQKYAVAATGFTNRGLVNRTGLSVLNKTKMPACLIEYGFITNPTEAASMKSGTTRYGKALYNATVALCKSYGLY